MPSVELSLLPPFAKRRGRKKNWPVPPNPLNTHVHWAERKYSNDKWFAAVKYAFLEKRTLFGKLPLEHPKISIFFHQTHPFDYDGAYAAAKILLDSLKTTRGHKSYGLHSYAIEGLGVIADDGPTYIDYEVKSIKVKKKNEEKTTIIIEWKNLF